MPQDKQVKKQGTAMQPTAALVMTMAAPLYTEGVVGKFMEELDLSSGIELKGQCDYICPWYGEVVLDRKFLVHHLASAHIATSPCPCRVVIPAAGMSPLALQLIEEWNSDKLAEVIEFDIAGMPEKKEIYQHLVPGESHRLKCSSADIKSQADLHRILPEPRTLLTTILVLEGITYYLPPEIITHLLCHAILGYASLEEGPVFEKIIRLCNEIDHIITRLDMGFLESEKVRDFLKKHYDISTDENG